MKVARRIRDEQRKKLIEADPSLEVVNIEDDPIALQLQTDIENLSDFTKQKRGELIKRINDNRLNVPAMVLSLYPKSKIDSVFSRTMVVLIGSLVGVNHPEAKSGDGYISVEVSPPKGAAPIALPPRGRNTQAIVPAPAPYREERLYTGSIIAVGVPIPAAEGLGFGDVIILTNVTFKDYFNKNAEKKMAVNASECNKVPSFTMADAFYLVKITGKKNTFLKENTLHYDERTSPSRYANDIMILSMDCQDSPRYQSHMEDGSVVTPIPGNDIKDLTLVGRDGEKAIVYRTVYNVIQWKGGKYTQENNEKIFLEFNAYQESLRGFYIMNPDAWSQFAPNIFSNADIVTMSKLIIDSTEQNSVNVTLKRIRDGVTSAEYTPPFDFGLSVLCIGILVDAATVYSEIGIRVTPSYAQEMFVKMPNDTRAKYHKLNLHSSFGTTPPVICLNEYADDTSKLWADPNVQFRVLTNGAIKQRVKDDLAKLTPEEGNELITLLSSTSRTTKNQKLSELRERIDVGSAGLQKYLFAIFVNRLSTDLSPGSKMFIEGIKNNDEEEHPVPFNPDDEVPFSQPTSQAAPAQPSNQQLVKSPRKTEAKPKQIAPEVKKIAQKEATKEPAKEAVKEKRPRETDVTHETDIKKEVKKKQKNDK